MDTTINEDYNFNQNGKLSRKEKLHNRSVKKQPPQENRPRIPKRCSLIKLREISKIQLFPISSASPRHSQSSGHRERLKILMVTKSGLINSIPEKVISIIIAWGDKRRNTSSTRYSNQ
ncbi:hypothetical protein CEXT_578651 [Caerostris extrusa]|uniref:Uncharacterized protein n=1 Tax=Caerostris extrusa TaxID=172846 RepID=A0AAV4WUD1_CAEEX|nr:hypothetical protein CEXT_578651 [Caerostris extrusa]